MKYRITTVVAALLVAAFVAAGCGSEMSKGEYEKSVNKIAAKVEKQFDSFDSEVPTQKDIDDAQGAIDTAVEDLDDLDPPSEVKDLHEDMVKTIRGMSDVLDRMAPLLKKAMTAMKDPASVDEAEMTKLQGEMEEIGKDAEAATKKMEKISKAFKKKGYDIDIDEG